MTVNQVRDRVEAIRRVADDDETAHNLEDALHHQVLMAIANDQCVSKRLLAAEALKTLDIDFQRWCA